MVVKNFLFCLALFATQLVSSQGETKNWYFGNGAGISFNSTSVNTLTNGALTSSLGCSSISDFVGNLLFYTDGVTVWNQTHAVMANGTGLLGNNCAQSCIIIKKPSSSTLYYIFTVQGGGGSAGLNYSLVDMSLASGQGSVTSKNVSIYSGACEEKICATKHCNGTDIWILTLSGGLQARLLTSTGLSSTVVTNTTPTNSGTVSPGSIKISPNGKKLAICANGPGTYLASFSSSIFLYDFDNNAGVISNYLSLQSYNNAPFPFYYGCEFSPDGSKFYANFFTTILQWDLCNLSPPGIANNTTLTDVSENPFTDNYTLKGSLQLAPDGKIYVARIGKDSLGVINFPNLPGNSSLFVANGQSIGTATCGYGLPNFVSSYFEKRSGLINFNSSAAQGCMAVNFIAPTVCAYSGYTISGTQWYFGDPLTGAANTSSLTNPTHTFSAAGTYTTRLIVFYDCGASDTILKIIPVTSPTVTILNAANNCGAASASASTIGGTGTYSYTWTPSLQTTSVATNLSGGNYTLNMKDSGGGCAASATANIVVTTLNAVVNATHLSCYNSSNGLASVAVSGGSGSYSYSWSATSQTTSAVTGLSANIYTVTALDQIIFCAITKTLQLTQPPSLVTGIVALSTTACIGSNLILYAGPSGGSPAYSYVWGNGHTTAIDTINAISSGNYTYSLSVLDANMCAASATLSLNFIGKPILSAPTISLCALNTATMSVSGANSYTWQPGALNATSFTTSPITTSIYTITGETLGCSSTITTALNVFANPIATLSSNSPVCVGQTLNLTGGNGSTYLWAGPAGFFNLSQNPSFLTTASNQSGFYSLTVSNANSCSATASMSVTINASPSLSVTGNFTICTSEKTQLSVAGADAYAWSNGLLNTTISLSPSVTAAYTVSGNYLSTGCSTSSVITITVLKCTGLFGQNKNTILSIYPNPFQEKITVESSVDLKLSLWNELGQFLKEQNVELGKNNLDMEYYPAGVYFLKVDNAGKIQYFQLIKTD